MLDYIIVGSGLSGLSLAHTLCEHNKTFVIYDNQSQNSTAIAAGLYNPVVLKRFTSVWKAKEQLDFAIPFYLNIEQKLDASFLFQKPLQRIFKSIEEQNSWFEATDKVLLSDFLNPILKVNTNASLKANYKLGEVLHSGYLDTKVFKAVSEQYFFEQQQLIFERFDYSKISFFDDRVSYMGQVAKRIVFCEGFGIQQNPYFNYLPLDGTKGEILTIQSPDLKLNDLINSGVFIIPLGNDLYRVGATYNWLEKDDLQTEQAKEELLNGLRETISCDFNVLFHDAGVRPTVKHRRPILGVHHEFKNLFLLNGLGTRGVMLAPYLANQLFDYIEKGILLMPEVDISKIKKPTNKL